MQAAVLVVPAVHRAVQQTTGLTGCLILCTRLRMRHVVLPHASQGRSLLVKSIMKLIVYSKGYMILGMQVPFILLSNTATLSIKLFLRNMFSCY